jgi:poly-gamma-glutamate capsule biosynthesis protein CapA/YwtB (metallophosphatase superfamily)
VIKLFLSGDVMTGRGMDQILAYPCAPQIFEEYCKSALDYITLAERVNGPIKTPVAWDYIWGEALDELSRRKPDARIVNLETAITSSGAPEPKGINYRMNLANIAALTVARLDACVLSNNHVLDWGVGGLLDTLEAVRGAGILTAGAGRNLAEASAPAIIQVTPSCRVLVFGLGLDTGGIPPFWAATQHRPGVNFLCDLSQETAQALASEVLSRRQPGDIAVISIHWGSNWGYHIAPEQKDFARTLIDLGACDILHGHSSHHARAIEIYRRKLILYGCGDFINDYEGIREHEEFRGNLLPMYLANIGECDGTLDTLEIILFKMSRFCLRRAPREDVQWFQSRMNDVCAPAAQLSTAPDGSLVLAS